MKKDFSDNETLINSLKAEDLAAFDFLYTSLRERLFILAYSILHNQEASKDLVQDIFMEFWEEKVFHKITSSPKTYLLQSARNRALKILDKEKTARKLKRNIPGTFEYTKYYIENQELHDQLEAAIQKLPPMAQKVFRMHYEERLSHKQIAAGLNISTSTVSSHIDRALKELRKQLESTKKVFN